MSRENIDLYKIGSSNEELQQAIIALRQDFDAHNHDGASSVSFQTLIAETISARAISIRKTSFTDATAGMWMGLVGDIMKLKLGSASSSLSWNGTTLSITGSITATAGTIGGWTIGATTLTGGGVTLNSSTGSIDGASITAASISGATIIGSTLTTASSGQRVVLTSTLSSFYNSSGTEIIETYASGNSYLIKGIQAASSIALDAGSSGAVVMGRNGTFYVQADNTGIHPYSSSVSLGTISSQWTDLWLSGIHTYQGIDQPVIYFGLISGTSISNDNTVPFSVAHPSTGKYTITHNFGSATSYVIVANAVVGSGLGAYTCKVESINTNDVKITIFDDTGTVQDADFTFILTKIP